MLSGMLAPIRPVTSSARATCARRSARSAEHKSALEAAGASLSDLVRTQTFVTDIEEFFRHMDERMKYFFASPTSSTIQISRLSHPDFMIEVEAMAVIAN